MVTVVRVANAYDVAHDGLDEVYRGSSAADDIEDMSMQVGEVLHFNNGDQQFWQGSRTSQAHRSAGFSSSSTASNVDFDALLSRDRVDAGRSCRERMELFMLLRHLDLVCSSVAESLCSRPEIHHLE
jgi:hypothetical protein